MAERPADVVVSPVKITVDKPTVNNPAVAGLLPTTTFATRFEFIVKGINNAIANAIRRTVYMELPNYSMTIAPGTFRSTDPFLLIDMITRRIQLIPILQSPSDVPSAAFELNETNKGNWPIDITSAALRARKGPRGRIFNDTFVICTLQPGKSLAFSATVEQGRGISDARFATVSKAVSIPIDQRPINQFDAREREPWLPENDKATYVRSCSASHPRNYLMQFESHGTEDPIALIARACADLQRRLDAVLAVEPQIYQDQDLKTITIHGETATIGNLLMRCCLEVYPGIPAIIYAVDDRTDTLKISIRTDDQVDKVMAATVGFAKSRIAAISAQLVPAR